MVPNRQAIWCCLHNLSRGGIEVLVGFHKNGPVRAKSIAVRMIEQVTQTPLNLLEGCVFCPPTITLDRANDITKFIADQWHGMTVEWS